MSLHFGDEDQQKIRHLFHLNALHHYLIALVTCTWVNDLKLLRNEQTKQLKFNWTNLIGDSVLYHLQSNKKVEQLKRFDRSSGSFKRNKKPTVYVIRFNMCLEPWFEGLQLLLAIRFNFMLSSNDYSSEKIWFIYICRYDPKFETSLSVFSWKISSIKNGSIC